ncbi:hypothetical protein GCM10018962_37820 [Dactylosporangium matsuzakiense]|uniref:Uncharacterized protein n=1 Tax=Dactylosporangium matsuzakiense TaxID=53360 RepID=A0A9W6NP84_9ACTN|nr:hypothetical protein GCM10017581_055830 [Dactylosporangium matsuzakiense]
MLRSRARPAEYPRSRHTPSPSWATGHPLTVSLRSIFRAATGETLRKVAHERQGSHHFWVTLSITLRALELIRTCTLQPANLRVIAGHDRGDQQCRERVPTVR